ncbi:MAG: hypothetical protein OEP95_06870 [Myxococcales bacterium]|nr:hypothetical protein [Myxococcales bacterium]
MDAVVDERQHEPVRVVHVPGHVHQALAEPDRADRRLEAPFAAQEVHRGDDREYELPERAAEKPERAPEDAEEDVPGFVEQEVRAVQEVVVVREDQPEPVRNECEQQKRTAGHGSSSASPPRQLRPGQERQRSAASACCVAPA